MIALQPLQLAFDDFNPKPFNIRDVFVRLIDMGVWIPIAVGFQARQLVGNAGIALMIGFLR